MPNNKGQPIIGTGVFEGCRFEEDNGGCSKCDLYSECKGPMIKECRKESKSKLKWYHGNWKRIQPVLTPTEFLSLPNKDGTPNKPASTTPVCEWVFEANGWLKTIGCGPRRSLRYINIKESQMSGDLRYLFCPMCGKTIKEVVG